MSTEFEPPQELKAVEQALAGIAPTAPRIDRDRLMFLAGAANIQASGGREPPEALTASVGVAARNAGDGVPYSARGLLWPATAAAFAATSLALVIALLNRPAPAEKIVYRDRQVLIATGRPQALPGMPAAGTPHSVFPTAPGAAAIPADNYVRSRDVALRLGLDALGNWPSGGGRETPAPTVRSLLESLLPAEPGSSGSTTESLQL